MAGGAGGRVVITRASIWWASLPDPLGSTPGFRQPVVVVQADAFNVSRIATVIVVALTTNLRLVAAPGNVFIPATTSGLPRDSVANVSQLYTLDRSLLTEEIGSLPHNLMARIDRGLRLVMAL